MTDLEYTDLLIKRVQDGDALAFEKLYYHALPKVAAFIMSRSPQCAPLDDLVQEVFCRLWEQRGRFRGAASGQTYLLGIANNVLREYCRSARRRSELSLSDSNIADTVVNLPEEPALIKAELCGLLRAARANLSAARSSAITLIYDLQLAPRDAARVAGCTEKAFRLRLDAARRQLRRLLQVGP